jgi:excisionase family DNA binding protein
MLLEQLKEDKYIDVVELAQMFKISRATAYQMAKKGFLPRGRKIGSLRRWSLNELHEFMKGDKK